MCAAAGSVVLPDILKLAEVMEMSGQVSQILHPTFSFLYWSALLNGRVFVEN